MSQLLLLMNSADARLYRWLATARRPWPTRLMLLWTRLGDPQPAVTVGILLVILGGVTGALAAFSGLIAFALSQALKRAIARPRPSLGVGFRSVIEAPDHFSFPSGHAAVSLALALPWIGALHPTMGLPLAGAVLLIGVSRGYLGVHYPGDVVAGWILAIISTGVAGLVL